MKAASCYFTSIFLFFYIEKKDCLLLNCSRQFHSDRTFDLFNLAQKSCFLYSNGNTLKNRKWGILALILLTIWGHSFAFFAFFLFCFYFFFPLLHFLIGGASLHFFFFLFRMSRTFACFSSLLFIILFSSSSHLLFIQFIQTRHQLHLFRSVCT